MRNLLICCALCCYTLAFGQQYPPINEHLLAHTYWQYSYQSKSSNHFVVHRADSSTALYFHFGYDQRLVIVNEAERLEQPWRYERSSNELVFAFQAAQRWSVVSFQPEHLILECMGLDSSLYRYHFKAIRPEQGPFDLALWELPTMNLVDTLPQMGLRYPHRFVRDEKGKRGLAKPRLDTPKPEPTFIQIEMVGGGFFGGADPIYRNSLVIKTDGTVVRQIQTELQGLREYRYKISRQTLEDLFRFIEGKRFFEFQQGYNCQSAACVKRMRETPRPVAFRLAVTYGERRKMVAVSIWEGPFGLPWVDYPNELNHIVQAIEKVSIQ